MREVTEVWARQEAGIAQHADLGELEDMARADARQRLDAAAGLHLTQWVAYHPALLERWAKFRGLLNTVFPCPHCRPEQFARWRHGCYQPNHQRKRCSRCKEAGA